ncbi:bifunctional serine/threonine-protein kinase/ABC transporter substrate-binding protein [Streptomyces sp. NBC_01239]|uniref:bifunctional serine/threonine-protein kinase/ABC transporter substrate-binding protein n=1 Tax=Streptomyces sp. NBC_01239 TaxID=2903792 RepID=UPI00225C1E1B|nr:bifunctional serine/threonine-protein kinase/ABC transporter substrate-binding protein [Streptomyces sp. NBC_01239]MCX4818002.1 bifunctional serine/threonine-protein kinase/ABC transporter substrate-binding protein [Streptomyces sp. NBC_01239]
MQALRAEDPEHLGGHRLLARLGAGGMGVVYLARTGEGTPVALKVIRAEYAADPAFRARFRREVRLATGLTGRWVVAVTAADTEAREPWLATAFVPGPSLAEAVDGLGQLPASAVVTLGARLAETLGELHAVDLVHRDVKPGNILLVPDGPRLIDFGIAKGAGATALTAPDAVVGTPGYLSPEQTRTRGGEVGPASDLFSLGCVLAYAATGRRPFGTGEAPAVLYRTVHEPPDPTGLDQLPPSLRTVIDACLAKDPALRPSAAEVRAALTDEQRKNDSLLPMPDWLPPAVLRLVAERSARALDPPPRTAGPEPLNMPSVKGSSRRRMLAIGSSAAAALAASGTGAAVLLTRGHTATTGSHRTLPTHTLALHADLTGTQKSLGQAQERGARLAVAAHNARASSGYRLALTSYDDGGDPARARETARRIVAARSVSAVVGPSTTTGARAAAPLYAAASLPVVLVSADDDGLTTTELRTLCVTRASGSSRTLPVLFYLTRSRPSSRTAIIQDRAAGETAADIVRNLVETPPAGGTVTVHQVAAVKADFGPVVAQALAAGPQAVVYGGTSPRRAAACARALAGARFAGAAVGFEPVMRAEFLTTAGPAAEGWVLEAPYTQAQSEHTAAARAFTAAYRTRYGVPPGQWSAEAYDAVGLIARAIDALGTNGTIEPAQVAERLFHTSYAGVAKPIRFEPGATHAMDPANTAFLYQVKDGAFRFLGRYDQVG